MAAACTIMEGGHVVMVKKKNGFHRGICAQTCPRLSALHMVEYVLIPGTCSCLLLQHYPAKKGGTTRTAAVRRTSFRAKGEEQRLNRRNVSRIARGPTYTAAFGGMPTPTPSDTFLTAVV